MTRNLEPGLEPQAHVRVRMYRYSGATDVRPVLRPVLMVEKYATPRRIPFLESIPRVLSDRSLRDDF
jgi:hypothetical protein